MSDKLVNLVREEDYLLKVFMLTKNTIYTNLTKEIVKFVRDIYRIIEPSHIEGEIVVFSKISDQVFFDEKAIKFYDESILTQNFKSVVFQLFQKEGEMPLFYQNINNDNLLSLFSSKEYIAYHYQNNKETIYINGEKINIINKYSCPSIFALQYHFLNEALLIYKNERVRKVSCEHFKKCWSNDKYIYFVNKPEDTIQLSLSEYLKNRLRGVDVVREYNLNASKPVDVRVFWREANRAALIEVKLMGRSLKSNGEINTYEYGNNRVDDGMSQIKEYIDLVNQDSPNVINKGYLVVIDGRRNGINLKTNVISIENGMFFSDKELEITEKRRYYITHKNIEQPIRMFVEPICD